MSDDLRAQALACLSGNDGCTHENVSQCADAIALLAATPAPEVADDEREEEVRVVSCPSAAALFDLLTSLNDAGHHPEVALLEYPALAGLWDPDYASATHYVHTDPDTGQEHCCDCEEHRPDECHHEQWSPDFPALVVLMHDPDPSDLLDGPAAAWWRAPVAEARPDGDALAAVRAVNVAQVGQHVQEWLRDDVNWEALSREERRQWIEVGRLAVENVLTQVNAALAAPDAAPESGDHA